MHPSEIDCARLQGLTLSGAFFLIPGLRFCDPILDVVLPSVSRARGHRINYTCSFVLSRVSHTYVSSKRSI